MPRLENLGFPPRLGQRLVGEGALAGPRKRRGDRKAAPGMTRLQEIDRSEMSHSLPRITRRSCGPWPENERWAGAEEILESLQPPGLVIDLQEDVLKKT